MCSSPRVHCIRVDTGSHGDYRGLLVVGRHGEGLDAPDLVSILCDGAVTVELRGARSVHDAASHPLALVLPHLVNLLLH